MCVCDVMSVCIEVNIDIYTYFTTCTCIIIRVYMYTCVSCVYIHIFFIYLYICARTQSDRNLKMPRNQAESMFMYCAKLECLAPIALRTQAHRTSSSLLADHAWCLLFEICALHLCMSALQDVPNSIRSRDA